MQKKKINKVLIIVVALIWGVVIYKFITPYFLNNDAVVITADALVNPSKVVIQKKDTVQLMIPERDPFLGKTIRKVKTAISKPVQSKKKQQSKTVTATTWPSIEYLGFIKSKNSTSKLGLVRINGVLKRVRSGAEIRGVIIKSIAEEKIVIQLGKDIKDFFKKK